MTLLYLAILTQPAGNEAHTVPLNTDPLARLLSVLTPARYKVAYQPVATCRVTGRSVPVVTVVVLVEFVE